MTTLRNEVDRIIHEFLAYLQADFRRAFDNLLVRLQELDIIGNQSYDYDRVIMELLRTYQQSLNMDNLRRQWDYAIFGSFLAGYGGGKENMFIEYGKLNVLVAATAMMMGSLNNIVGTRIRAFTGKEIAQQLHDLYSFVINRGELMAITEFHRAAIIGQLSQYERQHIRSVQYHTEEDELVCPRCGPLNKKIFSLNDSKGMIPRHPRCRCWWDPVTEEAG